MIILDEGRRIVTRRTQQGGVEEERCNFRQSRIRLVEVQEERSASRRRVVVVHYFLFERGERHAFFKPRELSLVVAVFYKLGRTSRRGCVWRWPRGHRARVCTSPEPPERACASRKNQSPPSPGLAPPPHAVVGRSRSLVRIPLASRSRSASCTSTPHRARACVCTSPEPPERARARKIRVLQHAHVGFFPM